ncbi:MAG: GNAT family N-acetyltransferase [Actinobacteria bacterium]|nr:GNAT family N-acetyltransferase [Actinomycetota bacterium]
MDDDVARIDQADVHRLVSTESYWATGRTRQVMDELIDSAARVVGLYAPDGSQVGFCRVLSDRHTFAYLADVYVRADHRGHGLGVELVREAIENGPLARLRWLLFTADAHDLYRKLGFADPSPNSVMQREPVRGRAPR